ncbi:carbohydrate ABC transporter permease, partial [Mesorhizobium sp. M8A.F.Ca.ET.059.01.1.1]
MSGAANPSPILHDDAGRRPKRLGARGLLEVAGLYAALALVLIETLYPLLWVLFGSLKTKQEMLSNIWGPPSSLVFQNYVDAWRIAGMGSRIFSSILVTGSALIILVAVATPCAYALARLRFPGRGLVVAVA